MEGIKVAKFTVSCPCCGKTLAYDERDKSVECFACDNSFDTAKLGGTSSASTQSNMGGFSPLAAIGGFDNPESGVVFIENFFETYDWTEYYESNELFISEIAEIVKNNKVKNGANAQSWYLDFKALAVPVQRKLEGLDVKQAEIIEKYNKKAVEILSSTDTYINDLYALTKSFPDSYRSDWVHFYTPEGTEQIGGRVLSIISNLLDIKANEINIKDFKPENYSQDKIAY